MGGGERGSGEIEMDGELLTVLDTLENEATVSGGFFTLRQALTSSCLDQIAPLLYPLAYTHIPYRPRSRLRFILALLVLLLELSFHLNPTSLNNAIQFYHLLELSVICPLDSVVSRSECWI